MTSLTLETGVGTVFATAGEISLVASAGFPKENASFTGETESEAGSFSVPALSFSEVVTDTGDLAASVGEFVDLSLSMENVTVAFLCSSELSFSFAPNW